MLCIYHGRKVNIVELNRAIITEWQKLSQRFIDSSFKSTNGVLALNVLWRMTVDISNTSISHGSGDLLSIMLHKIAININKSITYRPY